MQPLIPETAAAHRAYCEARAAHRAAGQLRLALFNYLPPVAAAVWDTEHARLTNALLDARAAWLEQDAEAWLSSEANAPIAEPRLLADRTV